MTELKQAAGVSLGQVSNVRKLLLDHEWAEVGGDGLRLNKPEELARAWQKSYEPRPRSRDCTMCKQAADRYMPVADSCCASWRYSEGERGAMR